MRRERVDVVHVVRYLRYLPRLNNLAIRSRRGTSGQRCAGVGSGAFVAERRDAQCGNIASSVLGIATPVRGSPPMPIDQTADSHHQACRVTGRASPQYSPSEITRPDA